MAASSKAARVVKIAELYGGSKSLFKSRRRQVVRMSPWDSIDAWCKYGSHQGDEFQRIDQEVTEKLKLTHSVDKNLIIGGLMRPLVHHPAICTYIAVISRAVFNTRRRVGGILLSIFMYKAKVETSLTALVSLRRFCTH